MEKYSIDIDTDHIIAVIDRRRVLIDTGAPVSIGDRPEIVILGQTYSLENKLLGMDIRQISEQMNTEINALLGMDILSKFMFYISHGIKGMICSDYFINFTDKMQDVQINFNGTIPTLDLKIDGVDMKMILDTGAKLSYLNPSLLEGRKSLGRKEDFYAGVGAFTAEVYEVPAEIKGNKMGVHFSRPPEWLEKTLYLSRCNGILGSDIFRYFNVQFCFKNNRIWLVEKSQQAGSKGISHG